MKPPKPLLRTALIAVAVTTGFSAVGAGTPTNVPCVDSQAEARYRAFGYDHVVLVHNGCEESESCDVSTNVNHEPQRVDVASGKVVEVLTFRGSPARAFTAKVTCVPTRSG